jgi:transcriptional regulator with XRE-family HTH domain
MATLKELRRRAPMTQAELSAASGVSRQTISEIENGHGDTRPSTVRRLAKALRVKPQDLDLPAPRAGDGR